MEKSEQSELDILKHTEIEAMSSDDEIEIVKEKPKKELSDKQKETLLRAREKRQENIKKIREDKEKQKQQAEKEMEEKIVKKAIAIKKKQIKKEKVIQLTPDEEEIYQEEIKTPVKRTYVQVRHSSQDLPKASILKPLIKFV